MGQCVFSNTATRTHCTDDVERIFEPQMVSRRQQEVAKGMKVLVTNNIATDWDITNGARGEIADIIRRTKTTFWTHRTPTSLADSASDAGASTFFKN
ncbi:hypothetical protein BJV78DRAFT_1244203 [Lactifluus subvellereus]|nr:hypothetical protein BJV78DRAFT_1244203 [Lactifluus subvellereus]